MDKGIIIYAFGKPTYGKMAFNLAVSLKFNSPDIPICLIHDDTALSHLNADHLAYFNKQVQIDKSDLWDNRTFSPGKAKLSGYKYFPFERNMIIDADSVCIKPIEPLFEMCDPKPIYSQTVGTWLEDAKDWTCQWMALKVCKEVFDLPEKYRLFEINSSFMYVRKCKESQAFYNQALQNYEKGVGNPGVSKIWGRTFPDELAFNIAFAQTGIEPNFNNLAYPDINNIDPKPVFFSQIEAYKPKKHGNEYYFLGCYGGPGFTSHSLVSQCDTFMQKYAAHFSYFHQWKFHLMMKNKHITTK